MTEVHWQTLFLLVGAFFLGAVIACSLKRKFYYRKPASSAVEPPAVTPADTEPKIEVAPRGQADSGSERFGSALAGGASVTSSTPAPVLAAESDRAPVQDSPPPLRDISHLRSVRSEALRGQESARPSSAVDDLKRIRGIGVLIEKKLNSLGVTSYEQVANWTGADIERVSQILDFKGRIERENWIEQARILSTGGQTEFSRRSDRGEV